MSPVDFFCFNQVSLVFFLFWKVGVIDDTSIVNYTEYANMSSVDVLPCEKKKT